MKLCKKFKLTFSIIVLSSYLLMLGCTKNNDSDFFIKGADISSLQAVEDYGGKFYDFNGKEQDALKILKKNGVNYLRLRIWNEPTLSFDAGDYCNLEHTIEMAQRIKKSGFKFLLDFHYSDWWCDPENQTKPKSWENLTVDEISDALYEYTVSVLEALDKVDAYPDMIQVGNEIGNGMLWNEGKITNFSNLAKFINSGIKAIRDTTPNGQDTKIMIHLQDGGSIEKSESFFSQAQEYGVTDYDIIGLSYYPYWHGTFLDLKNNINNLSEKFSKPVVVAETAYPFTYDNADTTDNIAGPEQTQEVGFEASVENQKLVTELVMNTVANTNGGLGVFYWEPTWLGIKGVGAVKGGGNGWENQAMFDYNGKALESLKAFKFEKGSINNNTALLAYTHEAINIIIGSSKDEFQLALPKTLGVLYFDGTIRETEVTWDISDIPKILDTFTSYTINGTVLDFSSEINVAIVQENLIKNSGFEDGNTGWTIEKTTNAGIIRNDDDSTPKSGEWSLHYWDNNAFDINAYQNVTIKESGKYNLEAWSQGVGNTDLSLELYITDLNGNIIQSLPFKNAGWAEWQNPQLKNVNLNAGDEVIVGLKIKGTSNDWGTLDDFSLNLQLK